MLYICIVFCEFMYFKYLFRFYFNYFNVFNINFQFTRIHYTPSAYMLTV
jgi:hypothetical protein